MLNAEGTEDSAETAENSDYPQLSAYSVNPPRPLR